MKKQISTTVILIWIAFMGFSACKKNATPEPEQKTYTPSVTTLPFSNIDTLNKIVRLNGEVTSEGSSKTIRRGFCWSDKSNPTVKDSVIEKGTGKGTFNHGPFQLKPDITYHFRAFAENAQGISYGNDIFITFSNKLPVVSDVKYFNVTDNGAEFNATVLDPGEGMIIEAGFMYSNYADMNIYNATFKKCDLTKLPDLSAVVTGLTKGNTYFVKSYAMNSVGITFGATKSFLTGSSPLLTLNDGILTGKANLLVDTISLRISAAALAGRKIKSLAITRGINNNTPVTLKSDAPNTATYDQYYYDRIKGNLSVKEGDTLVYKVTIEDDNGNLASRTYRVILSVMEISPYIMLGAQQNTYYTSHFFGTADNYKGYRDGTTGTDLAKDNSSKIDFLYYYSNTPTIANVLYSPDYPFARATGWFSEVSDWPVKNHTQFKKTTMTSTEFNALNGNSYTTAMEGMNWSTGTQDSVATLAANQVIAYKTTKGKRGLMLIYSVGASTTGQIILYIKGDN